jgi:hypothetical protein
VKRTGYEAPHYVSLLQPPATCSLLGRNILLSALFSTTINGEIRNAYNILVGISEGRRQFRNPKFRWEDNIKIDLKEIRNEDVHWLRRGTSGWFL